MQKFLEPFTFGKLFQASPVLRTAGCCETCPNGGKIDLLSVCSVHDLTMTDRTVREPLWGTDFVFSD